MALATTGLACASARAQYGDIQSPAPRAENIDTFIVLKEKLTHAVCDEAYVSRPPTLESLVSDDAPPDSFRIDLPAGAPEHEVVSFLLGDAVQGIPSEYVRTQLDLALKAKGLAGKLGNLGGEDLLEAQAAVQSVKRRAALDVCEALASPGKLAQLLAAKPGRFLEANPAAGVGGATSTALGPSRGGLAVIATDTGARFGKPRRRSAYLVPGWLEASEVVGVRAPGYWYRRLSNPVTNKTQSVQVATPAGVPLGILFHSREAPAPDWSAAKAWSEDMRARETQIQTYRLLMDALAIQALRGSGGDARLSGGIRKLEEFYRNLISAYESLPDEKQFDSYRNARVERFGLEEVTTRILGERFLRTLLRARVNGSYVQVGLFRPDPALHAIFLEYQGRVEKLRGKGPVTRPR